MATAIHRCQHCGRVMGDYEGGWGSINGEPLCHPNMDDRPDCYTLVTLDHHELPCELPECVADRQEVMGKRIVGSLILPDGTIIEFPGFSGT